MTNCEKLLLSAGLALGLSLATIGVSHLITTPTSAIAQRITAHNVQITEAGE
jgi:hypothetical protein